MKKVIHEHIMPTISAKIVVVSLGIFACVHVSVLAKTTEFRRHGPGILAVVEELISKDLLPG